MLEGENRGLQVMPKHAVRAAAGKIYVEEYREKSHPRDRVNHDFAPISRPNVTKVTFAYGGPWQYRPPVQRAGVAMRINVTELIIATIFGLIATALVAAGIADLLRSFHYG